METNLFFIYAGLAVVFIFFVYIPNNKKKKKLQEFLTNLKKGDKIVTTGGIHGKITELKDLTCVIDTGGGVKLKINRAAINMEASALLEASPKED